MMNKGRVLADLKFYSQAPHHTVHFLCQLALEREEEIQNLKEQIDQLTRERNFDLADARTRRNTRDRAASKT
jgi:hypothetical protein